MATLEGKQVGEEWPENPSSANSARATCSNTFASATRAPGNYSSKLARVQGDRLNSADSVPRLLPGCSGSPVTISQESPPDTPTAVSSAQGNPPGNPDSASRDAGHCPESQAVVQKDIPSIAAPLTKPQAGCLDSPASIGSNDCPDGRILVSSDRDINLDSLISGIIAQATVVPKPMIQGKCRGNLPSGIIPSGCQTSHPNRNLQNAVATSILSLERLEVDLYRGTHHWIPKRRLLYGGQIVGQALVAAAMSVPENLLVHSLHCYFVRPGDPNVPVLYQVDHIRDGKSFSVHSVKAIQHGQLILICQASFHKKTESPIQHQFTMPVVPAPENVLTEGELIEKCLRDPDLTENFKAGLSKLVAEDVPFEIKPINPQDYYKRESKEPVQCFWVRACGYIGEGNMKLHCGIAAYFSDYAFLKTALLPHAQFKLNFMASLDHSMWFHALFRSDEWMLFECESPWSGGCRGLVQDRFWKQNGVLAVSCAQEGVFYVKPNPAESKL